MQPDLTHLLPQDAESALLVGRAWRPGANAGPSVIAIKNGRVIDITSSSLTTCSELMNRTDPVAHVRAALTESSADEDLGPLSELAANSVTQGRNTEKPFLLAPVDLQAVKACGVTFAASMLERVIEERAAGDPAAAEAIRATLVAEVGADLSAVRPGGDTAQRLKKSLQDRGLWSQYLEVGIGPYAEIFSKSQPMSAVGTGADIGLHPESGWNNPEPEIVLTVNSRGEIIGATLGNDVNLRDFEGRSALLLGKAKDNNGSCALGPFIRLFTDGYSLEDAGNADIALHIAGDDGFELDATSSMSQISRKPADLVAQTIGAHHQYPDGLMLFLGTMFAPTKDRGEPGLGFTHKVGDVVTIATPTLGRLRNRVDLSTKIAPWQFGTGALMRNLAARGLLS
ncbi:MAG: fumarylacetoacetate hydrolase family protein [Alphaproteobacteria bacterium]